MPSKPLAIIGIDPGTTVGFAVLDLYGKIVDLGSEKNISLDNLIYQISEKCTPLIIGSDKVKVPKMVGKFAARVGAKIVVPQEDLKVEDKRRMTERFAFGNHHEMDALASALHALKQSQQLLLRINKLVPREDSHLLEEVRSMVVKEKVAVKKAVKKIRGE